MIQDFLQQNQSILIWLASISILTFIGTILLIPVILIRMSADYFVKPERTPFFKRQHPLIRLFGLMLKNLVGIIFLIAGFVMLFIPGQGLLTMFIGLTLINFPGKRKLERKLIFHPKIVPAINMIRAKAGKRPLILPTSNLSGKENCK
jgi:hypothetical protein